MKKLLLLGLVCAIATMSMAIGGTVVNANVASPASGVLATANYVIKDVVICSESIVNLLRVKNGTATRYVALKNINGAVTTFNVFTLVEPITDLSRGKPLSMTAVTSALVTDNSVTVLSYTVLSTL